MLFRMIGRAGTEIYLPKLDILCQLRQLQRRQNIRDDINSKLVEIAGGGHSPSEVVTRPYGVEREGEAYDIWSHILERVTDPSSIKNLWVVSEMFRGILRGKYIETRLPDIVQLILDKRHQYMLPDKAKKTLVNLRLISRQVKDSVEDICRTEKRYLALILKTTETVRRISETVKEIRSFDASFFPGNVAIHSEDEEGMRQFHTAITVFLRLVGHRIHHFTYSTFLEESADIYKWLRKWAMYMPNLEHLSISRHERPNYREPAPLLEEIEPFPNLPLLRRYEEAHAIFGVLLRPFVHRILEASPGIQVLQLAEGEYYVREHSIQVLESFVNLTSLRICPYTSLLQSRNLPWKLKEISFYREDMTGIGDEIVKTTVSPCLLFAFLKQFEGTLEHLEFCMVDFPFGSGFLELRNLKTLRFQLHESYKNINFLMYNEKLETLQVKIGDEVMWDTPQGEKYHRILRGSFLGKSIWEVFPYLKWIRLFTRGSFDWPSDEEMLEEFREHHNSKKDLGF